MTLGKDIEKLNASLSDSPWMASLTAALESKSNVALIVGTADNCAHIHDMFGLISLDSVFRAIEKVIHQRFGDYSVRCRYCVATVIPRL